LPVNAKVVFFDLKNVLLYFDRKKMHEQIADYCQMDKEDVTNFLLKANLGEKYEKGEIDSRTLFHYLPEKIRGTKGFPGWFDALSSVFEANNELTPLIKTLHKNGIKIFIFSNICEAHFSYAYTHFPTIHLFDGFILSYEVNNRKPEEKMFLLALEKASVKKEEAFFIEATEEYVSKAKSLGLDSEPYTTPCQLKEQLEKRGFLRPA
jgi:glucose-1-phosphatase